MPVIYSIVYGKGLIETDFLWCNECRKYKVFGWVKSSRRWQCLDCNQKYGGKDE